MWLFCHELLLWLSVDVARVGGVVRDTVVGINVIPAHQLANAYENTGHSENPRKYGGKQHSDWEGSAMAEGKPKILNLEEGACSAFNFYQSQPYQNHICPITHTYSVMKHTSIFL